ncbi:hypothetical protein F4781DRAFT_436537 [Annulohypoxylon bovei var. microspora]|nr:hypothetical protein F4781DRAFT_436537 [Annulohypoxylon bovei var. microspora]
MAANKRVPLPSSQPLKRKFVCLTSSSSPTEEPTQPKSAKRKRGKTKAITSCERCRHAHIKCVSRGPGEACENCAKRSINTCSLTQSPNKEVVSSTIDKGDIQEDCLQIQELQMAAAAALAYLEKQQLWSQASALS